VKVNSRLAFKFEVLETEIRNFLNSGSGVVEEQKERPVA